MADDFAEKLMHALSGGGLGSVEMAPIFENLLSLAISGLNAHYRPIEENGELVVLQRVLSRLKKSGVDHPVIFDVGANVGNYSLLVQSDCPQAHIHAFEPSQASFDVLADRLAKVSDGQVKVVRSALGAAPGEAPLFSEYPVSETASLYNRASNAHPDAANIRETVSVDTIDAYCAGNEIGHIHFLKIDVEGHEFSVLEGARRMIESGAIDAIQFEFGAWNVYSRTFFRDFWQLLTPQYLISRVMRDGLASINDYGESLELFFLQTFFADRHR